jgi:sec-independent protein translocase protein TatB
MFDIGWGEMVVIGVVALVAIGPKQLPGALRTAGHWVGRARRMASDFQNQFQEALREADVAEMKRQFDDAANAAQSMSTPNLFGSAKQDVEQALKIEPPAAVATTDTPAATTDTLAVSAPAPAEAFPNPPGLVAPADSAGQAAAASTPADGKSP